MTKQEVLAWQQWIETQRRYRKVLPCKDGMCGADDCTRCHNLIEDEDEHTEETPFDGEG